MAYMRLGDLLVSYGVISPEQLEDALKNQKESRQRLGDVLIQNGYITEQHLIDALQVQLGVDFIDLTAVSIPVELAKYVPRNIAKKYCVVPVKLVRDNLYLAMSDPLDFVAQDEVKTASRKRVIPMIATRRATEQAINSLYGSEGTARVIEEMKREAGSNSESVPAQMVQDTTDPEESAPTIRFVNSLIERAFSKRASDIHLEPQEGEMVVRLYAAIIQNNCKEIDDFNLSMNGINLTKTIEALRKETVLLGKKPKFETKDPYTSDRSTFILLVIMFYYMKSKEIVGEY